MRPLPSRFFYIARLVDRSTEVLASIEDDVDKTEAFTGEAVHELTVASEYQESYEAKRNMLKGTVWCRSLNSFPLHFHTTGEWWTVVVSW